MGTVTAHTPDDKRNEQFEAMFMYDLFQAAQVRSKFTDYIRWYKSLSRGKILELEQTAKRLYKYR